MSLFPFVSEDVVELVEEATPEVIREYEIDFTTRRLTGKIVEGVNALAVWAYLALKSKRYAHTIYSWYYGEEYTNLIGYSYSEEYLYSEVKRYITECLIENPHIIGIDNLAVIREKDLLKISFRLITDVGEVEMNV